MARHVQKGRLREWERGRGREKWKDIVADKEFEIFHDTYVYGSRGNEDGNTGNAEIHRRSEEASAEVDEVWIGIFAEILSFLYCPLQRRVSVVHTWKTAWVGVQLGCLPRMAEQNLTPFHQGDKSKIWHQKDSPAEDEPGKKGTWRNSIDAKRVLYWTENDHASIFIHLCLCDCCIQDLPWYCMLKLIISLLPKHRSYTRPIYSMLQEPRSEF